ncbi:hypothetical protein QLX67_13175 [Balneolaceae bacterium ANBcel3]|nr:hypothetical protein [Balneolaceae bacterium ANBcel3]
MVQKLKSFFSGIQNNILKIAGTSITGKVFIKFVLNFFIYVVGFFVITGVTTGVLLLFLQFAPPHLSEPDNLDRIMGRGVGSAGASYFFLGLYWVFSNTAQLHKNLKNNLINHNKIEKKE